MGLKALIEQFLEFARSRGRVKNLAFVIGWGSIIGAVFLSYRAIGVLDHSPRTDAAEIEARFVHVSPTVPGRVVAVHVKNNARVKKGEVLAEVDPEPYLLRLEQARAEAKVGESEVAQGERNLEVARTNATVAEEQIKRAKENLALAQQTLDRLLPLLPQGFVSSQQVDQARTARNDAQISLDQAMHQSHAASEAIGTLDTRKAQLHSTLQAMALAERDLRNTKIVAPFDGIVTSMKLDVGEYTATGQVLFTLINTATWEAVANFRETDLKPIHVGSRARVYVMTDPSKAIEGEVTGIGSGGRSDDSIDVLGMPYIARSLNWVRVARRYPVFIHLHEPPAELMRIGASAAVVIE
jgi:membrane fusion protein, multidrug efflux system